MKKQIPSEVRTLADLGTLKISACCEACHRVVPLDIPTLQTTLSPDYPLYGLQHGLVCTGCGARYPETHLLVSGGPVLNGGAYRASPL